MDVFWTVTLGVPGMSTRNLPSFDIMILNSKAGGSARLDAAKMKTVIRETRFAIRCMTFFRSKATHFAFATASFNLFVQGGLADNIFYCSFSTFLPSAVML